VVGFGPEGRGAPVGFLVAVDASFAVDRVLRFDRVLRYDRFFTFGVALAFAAAFTLGVAFTLVVVFTFAVGPVFGVVFAVARRPVVVVVRVVVVSGMRRADAGPDARAATGWPVDRLGRTGVVDRPVGREVDDVLFVFVLAWSRRLTRADSTTSAPVRPGRRPTPRAAPRCGAAGCTWPPGPIGPAHRS